MAISDNVIPILVFILVLQGVLYLGQLTVLELNPSGDKIFNCTGSMLDNYGDCYTGVNNVTSLVDALPSSEGSISATTGNLFTDTFSAIKTWLLDLPVINQIAGIITAPHNTLVAMNLPNSFIITIDLVWYGITLFLLVMLIVGR